MIINQSNLSSLFTGYNTLFQTAFNSAPSRFADVAMNVPSSAREENYAWLGTFPGLREWVGPRVIKNLSLQSHSIKNKTFESTISIPREDIEDDRLGVYAPMFAELGRAAKMHPDTLIFQLMKDAFGVPCYDGQTFFDTDHPVRVPGTDNTFASVANTDSGSGEPWFLLDTSRAIRPFIWQFRRPYTLVKKDQPNDDNVFLEREYIYGVDGRANCGVGLWQLAWGSKQTLDAAHYKTARAAMQSFKDDEGNPLGIVPDTLVCGPTNESAALKLLNSEYAAGGESNEWKGTAKLIVTPYLA
jgi:phage major head subunit gpT-like protein